MAKSEQQAPVSKAVRLLKNPHWHFPYPTLIFSASPRPNFQSYKQPPSFPSIPSDTPPHSIAHSVADLWKKVPDSIVGLTSRKSFKLLKKFFSFATLNNFLFQTLLLISLFLLCVCVFCFISFLCFVPVSFLVGKP